MTRDAATSPLDDPASRGAARAALRWARPASVAVVTAVLLAWTWPNCPEAITDFGRETYVPWRISEGEVLYRDLNYFNGPLAPHFNALAFEALGASLRTLKLANAAIAILAALLIYWMVRQISDCLAAVMAGITFAVLFAAAHLSGAGNFNWLTPYSHEATHGIALSLGMLACLWRAQARQSVRWLALAGGAFGLVLLTKVEVGVAAALGAASALGLMLLAPPADRTSSRRLTRAGIIAGFVLPAALPPAAAILLLALAMPLADAARGAAGAWLWLGDDRIRSLPFFKWVMGLDDPEANLVRLLGWSGAYALLLIASVGLGVLFQPRSRAAVVAAVAAALLVVVAMQLPWEGQPLWQRVKWSGMLRPLPLVLLLVLGALVMNYLSGRAAPERVLPRLSLAVFAMALLLKIILNARAFHYGFALAMPATMLLIALLVSWIPAWVGRIGGAPWVTRAVMLAVIVMLLRAHLIATQQWMAQRTVPIGQGPDRFITDIRGHHLNEVMAAIAAHRRPGDTLVAMPEGAMMNFLLRMPSPSRYQNFLPSEMMIYGEQEMLEGLRRRPPTFVAIVHRVAREYGGGVHEGGFAVHDRGRFGIDYATGIAAWLRAEYHPLVLSGAMPYLSDAFGVLLLRRHESDATTAAPDAPDGNMVR